MRLIRNRRFLAVLTLLLLVGAAGYLRATRVDTSGPTTSAPVRRGQFDVVVTTSGELRAREFVEVTVPAGAQQAESYQMKIASIVPEGTIVKKGDVVAELDRSTLATKMAEVSLAMTRAQAVYEQALLDTTLTLSKAREEIRTMEFGLEEKKLAKDQSTYEPPATKRQVAIDLEKAERALAQAKVDYKTRTEQAQAKMREVGTDLERQKNKLKSVEDIMSQFTIKAPTDGMVIYVKEWNGRKRTTGSQVSSWDPAVATLPDLTRMESITYVNEIDIRKIVVGQKVSISLDSDPTKKLTGVVTEVANVGEQRPNTDAKVFEVKVQVEHADTTLRPGMTTGNGIVAASISDALFIPLEAMNSEEGVPFVYRLRDGIVTKQEVITGALNENEIVVVDGLTDQDAVLLVQPADTKGMTLNRLPNSPVGKLRPAGDSGTGAKPIPTPPAAPKPAAPGGEAPAIKPSGH